MSQGGSPGMWAACRRARDAALRAGQVLVTTDYVVDETLTLVRVRLGVAAAEAWWCQVDGSARVRWEPIAARSLRAGRVVACGPPHSTSWLRGWNHPPL